MTLIFCGVRMNRIDHDTEKAVRRLLALIVSRYDAAGAIDSGLTLNWVAQRKHMRPGKQPRCRWRRSGLSLKPAGLERLDCHLAEVTSNRFAWLQCGMINHD